MYTALVLYTLLSARSLVNVRRRQEESDNDFCGHPLHGKEFISLLTYQSSISTPRPSFSIELTQILGSGQVMITLEISSCYHVITFSSIYGLKDLYIGVAH